MKNAEGWHAKDVTEGVVSLRAGYSFSLASLDSSLKEGALLGAL